MNVSKNETPIICIANSKGGVGKTQTVIELCAHLKAKQILVCDMDPQGSSTRRLLGLKEDELEENQLTIFDLLVNPTKCRFQELILSASENFQNVDVIPSDVELTNVPSYLNGKIGFEKVLSDQLDRIKENYDLVLIDTGPQITMLTSIALRATSSLIIPTDTSQDGIFGIKELSDVVDALSEVQHIIKNKYIILTASQKSSNKSNQKAKNTLTEKFQSNFLEELEFPHSVKVADSMWKHDPPIAAASILDNNHKLYVSYKKLSKLILK